jgi:XTP/dITP diphosphohydrolase
LLLNNLRGSTTRAAHFASAIACAFPNGDELTAEGRCDGAIAFAPMGEGGFGYDPVFLVPEMRKTFAQMTAEEKNSISHRGRAMEKFAEKLETYLAK